MILAHGKSPLYSQGISLVGSCIPSLSHPAQPLSRSLLDPDHVAVHESKLKGFSGDMQRLLRLPHVPAATRTRHLKNKVGYNSNYYQGSICAMLPSLTCGRMKYLSELLPGQGVGAQIPSLVLGKALGCWQLTA